MFISLFDLFKIGIGPSSSHTMGPMVAAERFLTLLDEYKDQESLSIQSTLYGSLAFTGKGHATDKAVIYGLLGFQAETFERQKVEKAIDVLEQDCVIHHKGLPKINFDPSKDLIFNYEGPLEYHPNGLTFKAFDGNGELLVEKSYYSVGGGFVLSEDEINSVETEQEDSAPHSYQSMKDLLALGEQNNKTIAEMSLENEQSRSNAKDVHKKMHKIWDVMNECIERGLRRDGILPGGLEVKRRAKDIFDQLLEEKYKNDKSSHFGNEWLTLYAMAVNEQNAAGSRVVTAPTNGAAGVIPAVLRYHLDFGNGKNKEKDIETYLLTAAAVGGIIKKNASISGAEVGCQGEVGSASAMAAAGLCAVMGGTNQQIENAAEIALEHHLGMTCDPIAGLVQVPCIERNGFGAVKAVTAASLSMRGDGTHFVPLDNCIETMRQTGLDMSERYKETSQGGLAVNLPEC